MTTPSTDPYANFKFRLEVKGECLGAFSEASIPELSEVSDKHKEKRPVSGYWNKLILRRGITLSEDLYNWFILSQEKGAGMAGKDVLLTLSDETQQPKIQWILTHAWPSEYEALVISSNAGFAIEILEIQLKRISRVK